MVDKDFIQFVQNNIEQIKKSVNEEKFNIMFAFLDERISSVESFVVMLGETSSGKSTLINGLLNSKQLCVGTSPTTGAVTEIMDDEKIENFRYCAVNKKATIKEISCEMFEKLSSKPDSDLLRLRLYIKDFRYDLKHLRLFDTPGYGSIQLHHEEILKNFIPESDIIIYVVLYKKGFQSYDNDFVSIINNMTDKDTKFYLVINRVPLEDGHIDNRIKEITQHASDCLHRELQIFLVNSESSDNISLILPQAKDLWSEVSSELKSEKRLERINRSYVNLQKTFLLEISNFLNSRLLNLQLDEKQKEIIQLEIAELNKRRNDAFTLIEKTFGDMISYLQYYVEVAGNDIIKDISNEIMSNDKWTNKDETVSFINSHLLPFQAGLQTKNISHYLSSKIEELDKEIDDILNTAFDNFQREIKLESTVFKDLFLGLTNYNLQKFMGYGLKEFFKGFGGAGGAGAGVANAAKRGLKIIGDTIGRTFTRETHNAVARFLSKVGATSTKAIGAAAAVIVEGVFYIIDVNSWQNALKKSITIAVDKWKIDVLENTTTDLNEFKKINKEKVDEYFNQYIDAFTPVEIKTNSMSSDEISTLINKIESLTKEINNKLK